MADICLLPLSRDPDSLFRACEALRRSVEAGYDLGDRSHHLRMLGTSLEMCHQDLGRQIAVIRELSPMLGLDVGALSDALDGWAGAHAACAAAINRLDLGRGG